MKAPLKQTVDTAGTSITGGSAATGAVGGAVDAVPDDGTAAVKGGLNAAGGAVPGGAAVTGPASGAIDTAGVAVPAGAVPTGAVPAPPPVPGLPG